MKKDGQPQINPQISHSKLGRNKTHYVALKEIHHERDKEEKGKGTKK